MFRLVDRTSGYLFSSIDLSQIIATAQANLLAEVEGLDVNRFLNTSPSDLVRYLTDKYRLHPPELRRDEWLADEAEAKVDVRHDSRRWIEDRSRPVLVPGQRITIEIPINGDVELLYARASTFSPRPPQAQVRGSTLVLVFDIAHDHGDFDVRQRAELELNEIDR